MIRVLFVDDEAAVLEGLQNALRPLRKRWAASFAEGAEGALALLREQPFDVLVTDMRMPGIDGAELFRRMKSEHPQVVRMVLSGQLTQEELLRALPQAHQILTKPCAPELLQATVERACALMSLLEHPQVKKTVASLERLPALPRLYWQLIAVLEDQEASLGDVAAVIGQDVAMTGRVLQLANSAYYGTGRAESSVHKAVSNLGLRTIQGALMSFELLHSATGEAPAGFSIDDVQRSSFRTATVAAALLDDPEQSKLAYSAAMLHEIGTVVMATRLAEDWLRARAHAESAGVPLFRAEEELLGYSHAEVGAQLLALWGLPYPLIAAVAHHHQPRRAGEERFGAVGAVHVADALVRGRYGAGSADGLVQIDMEYLDGVGAAAELPRWREVAAGVLTALDAKEKR